MLKELKDIKDKLYNLVRSTEIKTIPHLKRL